MSECVEWPFAKNGAGYGHWRLSGRLWAVHRLVWTLMHGDIPKGLVVRHKCDNKVCYNLEHLELGTEKDNMQDSIRRGRNRNSRKTHCIRGHEFTEDNTLRWGGKNRRCRTCVNTQALARYHAKKSNG